MNVTNPNMPKILYFEDDPYLAEMYVAKFRAGGFDVTHLTHPTSDVVALAAAERPGVIVMDVIMPGMDGFAATELLQEDERTRDVPILGFSNLGQPEDIRHGLDSGMLDYWIIAQHTPDQVFAKLHSIVTGRNRQS